MKFYDHNDGSHHTTFDKDRDVSQKTSSDSDKAEPLDVVAEGARVGGLILDHFKHWYGDITLLGCHNGEPIYDTEACIDLFREMTTFACRTYPNYMSSRAMSAEVIGYVADNLMDRIADAHQQDELDES